MMIKLYSIACLMLVEAFTSATELIHNLQCDPCTCTSSNIKRFNGFLFQTDADCSSRNLKTIPDRLPEGIQELNLDYNNIPPEELMKIKRFKKLKKLSLAYNHLQMIPAGLFHNADLLQELDLQGNVVEKIDKTTFHPLHNLRELNGLELSTSPHSLFENLTNLKYLDIKFHQEEIPDDIFETLMLRKIRLSLLNARNIPENLFHFGPKSLRSIAINGPQLVGVSETLFDNLEVLNELDLKVSKVQSLPENLFGSTTDTTGKAVNLVKIQIEGVLALPSYLFQSQQSLSTIILRKLKYLPQKLFNQLETLRELEYSTSAIYDLPNDYFISLKGLQYLNLSNNNLENLDYQVFSHLKSLYVLDLSYNNIKHLPDQLFRNQGMLAYVNLQNNELVKISDKLFKSKYTIENLDLSDNFISTIEENAFSDLLGVQFLNLAKNKITLLEEDVFKRSQNLSKLNLSRNAITELPDKLLQSFDRLEYFDISYNRIKYMPAEFFPQPWYLVIVDLTENSFECDCNMLIVVYTLVFLQVGLMGDVCATPLNFAGKSARDVRLADICGQKRVFDFYMNFGINPSSIEASVASDSHLDMSSVIKPTTFSSITNDYQISVEYGTRDSWRSSMFEKEIPISPVDSSQYNTWNVDILAPSNGVDNGVTEVLKITGVEPRSGSTPVILKTSVDLGPASPADKMQLMTNLEEFTTGAVYFKPETGISSTGYREITPTRSAKDIAYISEIIPSHSLTPDLPSIDKEEIEISPEVSDMVLPEITDELKRKQMVDTTASQSIDDAFFPSTSFMKSPPIISLESEYIIQVTNEYTSDVIETSPLEETHEPIHWSSEGKLLTEQSDKLHPASSGKGVQLKEHLTDSANTEKTITIPETDSRDLKSIPARDVKDGLSVTQQSHNSIDRYGDVISSDSKDFEEHKTSVEGQTKLILDSTVVGSTHTKSVLYTSSINLTQPVVLETHSLDKSEEDITDIVKPTPVESIREIVISSGVEVSSEWSDKIHPTTSYHMSDFLENGDELDYYDPPIGEEKAPEGYTPTVKTWEFQVLIGFFVALIIMSLVLASVMKWRNWYRARIYEVTE